jgi:ubiquinone/menaquinone biosynthesis C-methylase UbiE
MENKDSFGLAAEDYRIYRPTYPDALFAYLGSLCRQRRAALDCATGNGQAAVDLARYFARVAAFDSSPAQIAAALPHPRVEYRVGTAEALPFAGERFDLVSVAQAAHWFDLPKFYASLREVVEPRTVVAIWGYSYCRIDATIERIVAAHLLDAIEPYWAQGNRVIAEGYRTIEFPFEELDWPGFTTSQDWTRRTFLNYMRTWSAYRRYVASRGADPMPALDRALAEVWTETQTKPVIFDFVGRVGRVGPLIL